MSSGSLTSSEDTKSPEQVYGECISLDVALSAKDILLSSFGLSGRLTSVSSSSSKDTKSSEHFCSEYLY